MARDKLQNKYNNMNRSEDKWYPGHEQDLRELFESLRPLGEDVWQQVLDRIPTYRKKEDRPKTCDEYAKMVYEVRDMVLSKQTRYKDTAKAIDTMDYNLSQVEEEETMETAEEIAARRAKYREAYNKYDKGRVFQLRVDIRFIISLLIELKAE